MKISVVVCTHSEDRYEDFCEAVESIRDQTYDDIEIVIVVDGNPELFDTIESDYGGVDSVVTHCNDRNLGLLESRNKGARLASGEIVAFVDDDVVVDDEWAAELVTPYETRDVSAAGGKMTPLWVDGKPSFLPAEFYWLVGVTHRGFSQKEGYVRNTFGSNISFERSVFLELGGFDPEIGGRKGDRNLQAGETELCVRLHDEYGERVWYNPEAIVAHKVFSYRTEPLWLLDRAFWQGYSKYVMKQLVPDIGGNETEFLKQLLLSFGPNRVKKLILRPSFSKLQQFIMLLSLTVTVSIGYIYATITWSDG